MVFFITLINLFICLLRSLFYPIIVVLGFFSPFIRMRLEFERKNKSEVSSISFKKSGIKADVAFEVSSEGELEQIRPILMNELLKQKKIELIYSSESVENKCRKLFEDYPDLIRIFRLPLLSFSFFPWWGQNIYFFVSAKTLILCRYDFFPELMLLGLLKCKNFILVSATLKNKAPEKLVPGVFYKGMYGHFDFISCATKTDVSKFHELIGINERQLNVYDFRIVQILGRTSRASEVLSAKTFYERFGNWISQVDKHRRIIYGSIWPLEMKLFHSENFKAEIKSGKLKCVLAPHKLGPDFIKELTENAPSDLPCYVINRDMDSYACGEIFKLMDASPGLLIITVPAILCELYTMFGNAYVGGGHGRSIHSVLEPYVGMCRVFCGPKIHRSTEYDLICDFSKNQIHIVSNLEDFYQIFSDNYKLELDSESRTAIFNQFYADFESVTDKLLSKRNHV